VEMRLGTWKHKLYQLFLHFHQVPVAAGFEPSNIRSLVNCPTNCESAIGKVELTFSPFLLGGSCGWIWTLRHKIIRQLFYQLRHWNWQGWTTFSPFSPKCQLCQDLNTPT
jgi:hypothetical protein